MAEFALTRRDFTEASWHMQRRARRGLLVWALIVGGVVALALDGMIGDWRLAALTGLISASLGFSLRLVLNHRRNARIYDDHLASSPQTTLSVSDSGFTFERAGGKAHLEWDRVRYWSESPRFLMLYQGKDFAQVIPKDSLSEAEEKIVRGKLVGVKRL